MAKKTPTAVKRLGPGAFRPAAHLEPPTVAGMAGTPSGPSNVAAGQMGAMAAPILWPADAPLPGLTRRRDPADDPEEWRELGETLLADKKRLYLRSVLTYGTRHRSCDAARIAYQQPGVWREADPIFARLERDAHSRFTDSLEDEVHSRALDGLVRYKPHLHRGELIGYEVMVEKPDQPLLRALEARRPAEWRQRSDVSIAVGAEPPQLLSPAQQARVIAVTSGLTLEQLAARQAMVDAALAAVLEQSEARADVTRRQRLEDDEPTDAQYRALPAPA